MTVFTNARVFDGTAMLPGTHTVTLDGNRIASISPAPAVGEAIDLGGMTLMPGLITCHFHPDFYKFTLAMGMAGEPLGKEQPPGVLMAIAVRNCGVLLESGFTGYVGATAGHDIDASLKIAIEQGIMPGPRIRACSLHIGTTGDVNASKNWWREFKSGGTDVFADGPHEMRKLVREFIRRGAETIKIFTSSGHGNFSTVSKRTQKPQRRARCLVFENSLDVGAWSLELFSRCLEFQLARCEEPSGATTKSLKNPSTGSQSPAVFPL